MYAVDAHEEIHVLPDGPHLHPKILGLANPALQAGELDIESPGIVVEVNNLSGTFRFRGKRSLRCVADRLVTLGFAVSRVVWYPPDGASVPKRLAYP